MSLIIKNKNDIKSSEITSESCYRERRLFIAQTIATGLAWWSKPLLASVNCQIEKDKKLDLLLNGETPNSLHQITHYNNFYEYSTKKEAIALLSKDMKIDPWTLNIEGEVENPITLGLEDIRSLIPALDRTYRLRCVEGWSMVIPWQGFQLCELLKRCKPTSKAKYVVFKSPLDKDQFYGQRNTSSLPWPYTEALRIDEAMHPLTIMATGLYGKDLPNQNGAPVRLVVPWKYAFKSIKSITHIELVEHLPKTSWSQASPFEYGFYANVNPKVAHPRWSQRREVRIGELKKRKTLAFNGYADEVASLYSNMDLKKNF